MNLWKEADYKLCYIEMNCAYFTTQALSQQWGDDWNDAPYEYNAGEPYPFTDHDTKQGLTPWDVMTVRFHSEMKTPAQCNYTGNSSYSVEMINNGMAPWLIGNPGTAIFAGCNPVEFKAIIRANGGFIPGEDKPSLTQELTVSGPTPEIEIRGILDRLIKARKGAGLSQSQVAKLTGYVGAASTVSDWEAGKNDISLKLFLTLCRLYDCSVEWVLTGINPNFDPSDLMQKIQGASEAVKADLEDLMELLAMMRQEPKKTDG